MTEHQANAQPPVRFITATSLFDGHDATINIIRRILQSQGAEVIHLGHNRGVEEIVDAAIQEDVQGIAISSYQGGHNEFFRYMIDLLLERGAGHIKVFGGGGGVIIPREIRELMDYGVTRLYSPEDGRELGLEGMMADMIAKAKENLGRKNFELDVSQLSTENPLYLAEAMSWVEHQVDENPDATESILSELPQSDVPIIGLTGTGGAGKSCLTDEVIRRFTAEYPNRKLGVISVDPTKRKTFGALLGDRMRMNSLNTPNVYMRSLATRRAFQAVSASLRGAIRLMQASGFDLVVVETAGIGQGDSDIIEYVDLSVYVMTPEFGAATQLEKIDMLDFADMVVLNKFDKPGAEDALNAVRKQYGRNRKLFDTPKEELPIFGTIASHFNDSGANWFYTCLMDRMIKKKELNWERNYQAEYAISSGKELIPRERKDYLGGIVETIRTYKRKVRNYAEAARACYQIYGTLQLFEGVELPEPMQELDTITFPERCKVLAELYNEKLKDIALDARKNLAEFWGKKKAFTDEATSYSVRGKEFKVENYRETLSGLMIPKISVPKYNDWGDILEWVSLENFPGEFPYTAGVFPFKRVGEDPTRMFAGEGMPERTNRRFHYLAGSGPAARLSTAFDSITLYGADPAIRPDIFGKIGNAGVSICTVDDAKRLYSGFNLCLPTTSVSMTINGPAPVLLAFFMNAAIDQQIELYLQENGKLDEAKARIEHAYREKGLTPPKYRGELPEGSDSLGLVTLGISGDQLVDAETYQKTKERVLSSVRGTVQADILKEDQAQNTCIYSTEFSLKVMGDMQEFFTTNRVKNFYSVSISGYHIAEAGANPITQTALTLSNGFTYIEYYLARGLKIDDFAHNLSFFFSNGMDPEYAVIGRAARRIFSLALRERYHANDRSQKLKYHIQTSGRSLHAQEMDFNDIRTTLQALYAIYDNCNSLHTNAYDEAVTTPTEESVRRAVAIQLIVNKEMGATKNENPMQGSFIFEELTDLVEEAILSEFIRISDRGGVLGAMETMYQRNKIQEESLHYETLKHSGELPIIGVNTFLNPKGNLNAGDDIELARSEDSEKEAQLTSLDEFHNFHRDEAKEALKQLRQVCMENGNVFESLMNAVKFCSLGQISEELYRAGGEYRRNM